MQTKSEEIGDKLSTFWGHSKDFVKKAKILTVDKDGKNTSSSNSSSSNKNLLQTSKKYKPVDITSIWEYLEVCDTFGASRVVLVAGLILKETDTCCAFTPSAQLLASLPSDFRQRIRFSLKGPSSDVTLANSILAGCSAALGLQQTVLDDSRLLLLD